MINLGNIDKAKHAEVPKTHLFMFCMKSQFPLSSFGTFTGHLWSNLWSWAHFGPDPWQRNWRLRISEQYCSFGKSITSFKQVKRVSSFPGTRELSSAEQRPRNSSRARAWGLREPHTSNNQKYIQLLTTTAPVTHPKITLMFSHLTICTHRTEIPDLRTANKGQNN